MTLLKDFGTDYKAVLILDASAALGILQRHGVGRVRHLDVGALWLQEKEAQRRIRLEKVDGKLNPADLGTKYLGEAEIMRHLATVRSWYASGRTAAAAKLLDSVEFSNAGRRPRIPEDYIENSYGGWTRCVGGYTKTFKGARALRGTADHDPPWQGVHTYQALNDVSSEIIFELDVRGVRRDDCRLRRRLPGPCDLRVNLLSESDELATAHASEGGGLRL